MSSSTPSETPNSTAVVCTLSPMLSAHSGRSTLRAWRSACSDVAARPAVRKTWRWSRRISPTGTGLPRLSSSRPAGTVAKSTSAAAPVRTIATT